MEVYNSMKSAWNISCYEDHMNLQWKEYHEIYMKIVTPWTPREFTMKKQFLN